MDLTDSIKRIALNAVENSAPCDVLYGLVTSTNPLEILVDQRFLLTNDNVILSSLVQNIEIDAEIDGEDKNITLNLGLKVNEKVIILRKSSGQKFIVLDRMR
jgi:hypothetical protein